MAAWVRETTLRVVDGERVKTDVRARLVMRDASGRTRVEENGTILIQGPGVPITVVRPDGTIAAQVKPDATGSRSASTVEVIDASRRDSTNITSELKSPEFSASLSTQPGVIPWTDMDLPSRR
jgi:hypothetical protein